MFEITLDEMIYVLAQDMGLTDETRFIDRTDRIPQKPFNQNMKPLKRPERKQETETGAARDIAAEEQPQPKQQKPFKKKEKVQPAKEENADEAVEAEEQPSVLLAPAMDSMPGIKEEYADEANAAMNVGNGSIVQQQIPQEHVTTTPISHIQVGVNDVVGKFVTPHTRPEKLTPKNVYGDALANGKEYTQQIQVQQTQNQQQVAALDVNAINSYIASLPMDKKDEHIRQCCMDPAYPNMKGLVETRSEDKKNKLLEFVDFLPREKEDCPRELWSINLQCIIFALTSNYLKKKLTANGIPENVRFKEIRSTNPKYRFAFIASGDKKCVSVFVNPVPILVQYADNAGNLKYSWNVDSVIAVDDVPAK